VLTAVAAGEISRGEHGEEMGIQFFGAAAGPAQAEKVHLPFQMHQPVWSLSVLRCEHLKEVIANRLVYARDFREAA